MSQAAPPSDLQARQAGTPPRGAITWRSVTCGLLGVAFINLLTPYNDLVLTNTFLVGNSLPLGSLVLTFLLAVLINGPLSVAAPRHALNRGELGMVMAMMLVGSSMPGSGLMRYFPSSLVYPFYNANSDADLAQLFARIHLPEWLYPVFADPDPATWGNDPVTIGFVTRWTGAESPPYAAWIRPTLTWGVFFLALHGALLCMLALVRRQWYENERLSFPLARIQLSLLEPPPPGRWTGGVLASRPFWIAFVAINLLHTANALDVYQPEYFPEIALFYDFNELFSEEPWVNLPWYVKSADIFFTAIGVAYLLPGAISFSLWFMVIALAVCALILGVFTGDRSMPGVADQHWGGIFAYAMIVLWIGRRHWMVILRQVWRGERPGEPVGRYLSYRWSAWGFAICTVAMAVWMILAGMTILAALVATFLLLLSLFVVTRVVAETGLLHPGVLIHMVRPWQVIANLTNSHPIPVQSFWLTTQVYITNYDARESFGVYASHALKVADETVFDGHKLEHDRQADRAVGRRVIALMLLTLVVAFLLSLASMLWTEYAFHYDKQLVDPQVVNRHMALNAPAQQMQQPTLQYDRLNYNFRHDPIRHVAGGAVATVLLSILRLRYAWWPIHPIGYLFMSTWPMQKLWYSIAIGWLVRTLVLRFGGAQLYLTVQKAMLGMIVGEAVASFVWLMLGILFSAAGIDYHPIRFTLH